MSARTKHVEGVFRDGKVELSEPASDVKESRVLVTFLPNRESVNLEDHGIDKRRAAELRTQLQSFAEDWERPEMDIYDEL